MPIIKFGNHALKIGGILIKAKDSQFNQKTFNDIAAVYRSLQRDDKVAFLLRHGERPSDSWGKETLLTENGVEQCRIVGAKLQGGVASKNQIEAHSTDMYRTQQTAFYIAEGRGDELWTNFQDVPTANCIDGDIYYADGVSGLPWEVVAAYAYGELDKYAPYNVDSFKDITTVTNGITELVLSTLNATDKPLVLFTTHDSALVPFVVHSTKRKLKDLRIWETSKWLNFLAGAAIILRKNGVTEICPICGLDSGTMNAY